MNNSNKPLIVLLPGLDGTGELFFIIKELLQTDFDLMIINYPDKKMMDYKELLFFTEKKLLEIDRKFFILGESFSGPIAIDLSKSNEERILGVILIATFVKSPISKSLLNIISCIPFKLIPFFVVKIFLLGFADDAILIEKVKTIISNLDAKIVKQRLEEIGNCNVKKAFIELNLPILNLIAKNDLLVGNQISGLFKDKDNLFSIEIEVPHMLLQTKADECYVAIKKFVRGINFKN